MPKTPIQTPHAPAAIGPYSQAIVANGLVFVAGQTPLVPETGKLIEGDITAQTRQVIANITAILAEAGCSLGDVVKSTVFLADMADFAAMNAVYSDAFGASGAPFPARSTFAVKQLPLNAAVEIEVVATLP
ncbi:MAG: RidA family protein [Phototrophicaceae bacterium]|jgi:2-iminobutanoate/2-iminopropanoate deaminase